MRAFLLFAAGVLLAAGCGRGGESEFIAVGECEPGQVSISTLRSSESAVPAQLLDRGACDAARRAGVSVENVEILSTTYEEWGDTSLGCPKPNKVYPQVITPGYRLIVRAGERTYDYRASRPGETGRLPVILCEP